MDYCGPKGLPLSEFLSWDPDDQEAALLWQERERSRCPDCGTPHGDYDEAAGGDREAYTVEDFVCLGCDAIAAAREVAEKDPPPGLRFRLVPSWWLKMWGGDGSRDRG